MTIQTNDNFANHELSIDELDTIAAGNWLGDIGRAVVHTAEHAAGAVEHFFEGVGGSIIKSLEQPYIGKYLAHRPF